MYIKIEINIYIYIQSFFLQHFSMKFQVFEYQISIACEQGIRSVGACTGRRTRTWPRRWRRGHDFTAEVL